MARERNQSLPQADEPSMPGSLPLAERLFVQSWRPQTCYSAADVAQQCLEAAEDFERVRRERAEQVNA